MTNYSNLTDEEKKLRFNAINNLSNILWSKYQLPVRKYKELTVSQMEYMIEKLNYTDEDVKDVYENALKII